MHRAKLQLIGKDSNTASMATTGPGAARTGVRGVAGTGPARSDPIRQRRQRHRRPSVQRASADAGSGHPQGLQRPASRPVPAHARTVETIFDVGHNPDAARVLHRNLESLPARGHSFAVWACSRTRQRRKWRGRSQAGSPLYLAAWRVRGQSASPVLARALALPDAGTGRVSDP